MPAPTSLLTGPAILVALGRTTRSIRLLDSRGALVSTVGKEEVPSYLARGYEAHGRKRCLRYLCPPDRARRVVTPDPEWVNCLRTCGMPALQPSIDLMLTLYPHQL